jgi:hypothetical protein
MRKGKDRKSIRKELLKMNVSKEVLEDTINEAEWKFKEEKQVKEFDMSKIETQNVIDDKILLEGEDAAEKHSISPFFFFLIFIIIIWVGIAVSFNIAENYGRAIFPAKEVKDLSFTDFCLQKASPRSFEAKELCNVGQIAYDAGKTDGDGLKSECGALSFDPRLVSQCVEELAKVVKEFTPG